MRIREILTERGDTYFDNMGRVHFKTHDAYLKAKNSKLGSMRKAALAFSKRNPPVGELWPKDWNAPPQQDQYASQMTMPKSTQQTILDPNRGGLSTADLGRQQPTSVASKVDQPAQASPIHPPAPQNVRKMPLHPATKKAWIRQYGKTHNPDGTPKQ